MSIHTSSRWLALALQSLPFSGCATAVRPNELSAAMERNRFSDDHAPCAIDAIEAVASGIALSTITVDPETDTTYLLIRFINSTGKLECTQIEWSRREPCSAGRHTTVYVVATPQAARIFENTLAALRRAVRKTPQASAEYVLLFGSPPTRIAIVDWIDSESLVELNKISETALRLSRELGAGSELGRVMQSEWQILEQLVDAHAEKRGDIGAASVMSVFTFFEAAWTARYAIESGVPIE